MCVGLLRRERVVVRGLEGLTLMLLEVALRFELRIFLGPLINLFLLFLRVELKLAQPLGVFTTCREAVSSLPLLARSP